MRIQGLIVGLAAVTSIGAAAAEATAPYNEAVTIAADGRRVVEMPPVRDDLRNRTSWVKPSKLGGGPRIAIETPQGLMDCLGTNVYIEAACEPSNFGRVKWGRQWVVKRAGKWEVCAGRAKPLKCVGIYAHPYLPNVEE